MKQVTILRALHILALLCKHPQMVLILKYQNHYPWTNNMTLRGFNI